MPVEKLIHKRPNKGAAGVVEAANHWGVECEDFDIFLVKIWKSDENRPEIYQRKASAGPHWMHQLEPALQDKDPKR